MRRSLIWIALLVVLVAAGTASAGYPDGTHRRNVTRTPRRWESNPDWQPR